MKLSIIIPIYNEISTIDNLLSQLAEVKDEAEIIFVDGGSSDGCCARIPPHYRLIRGPKGRAAQMNAGADASCGDVLFFLHCDSSLPADWPAQIDEVMREYSAGCFGIAFASRSLLMRCCQFLSNFRIRLYKVAFGDQGIFVKREIFLMLGGFPPLPLMEDYQFSLELRKRKIVLGMTKDRIVTSDRRYRESGIIRTMWKMYSLRRMYRKGTDIDVIARLYKDVR